MQHRLFVLALVVGLAGCTVQKEQPVLDGQDVSLTILHTADIHSRLLPYDLQPMKSDRDLGLSPAAPPYGGVSRLATLIRRERARSNRVIHVDSGDCFQGAPIFNENLGEAEIQWLSLMGADAVVIGNHEFDAGAWNLFKQVSRHATYPLLAANYMFRDPNEPGVVPLAEVSQPYTILHQKGLTIGVIGMANISSLNSIVAEGNSMSALPIEQNEALRGWIDFVEPQVDLVVIVSHLGLTEDVDLVKGYERTIKHEEARPFVEREVQPWRLVEDLGNGLGRYFIPGVKGIDVIMGGHLHVVLNPPQLIVDDEGREVVLSHSGAFAKYLGRLDLVLHQDPKGVHGWEVKSHTYHAFPIDAAWCAQPRQDYDASSPDYLAWVKAASKQCADFEDDQTLKLLEPYILDLNQSLDLPRIFAYAPRSVERRNSASGGDAPLGNLTAESMRVRKRVNAEISITNTLGIRDAIYPGPVNLESMFNVFPFENTITVMYLSGTELQEVLDYVAERSAGRGCQSQAQIAGVRFIMDCGQVRANEHAYTCSAPTDCPNYDATGESGIDWDCVTGQCYRHPAKDITITQFTETANGWESYQEPLDPSFTYKIATNNYIAAGGSGFRMLKRNTTQFDTGISLRDALIEYMQGFCSCSEILDCDQSLSSHAFCAAPPASYDGAFLCKGRPVDSLSVRACSAMRDDPASANAGKCTCADVVAAEAARDANPDWRDSQDCGYVTSSMEAFCEAPLDVPVLVGVEDNRIERRVVDRSIVQ